MNNLYKIYYLIYQDQAERICRKYFDVGCCKDCPFGKIPIIVGEDDPCSITFDKMLSENNEVKA